MPKLFYHKYPNLVSTINNRYRVYNEELEKVNELEKEKKIFVLRPSRLVDIKRIERDLDKIQEMYDLGREDASENLEKLNKYLSL